MNTSNAGNKTLDESDFSDDAKREFLIATMRSARGRLHAAVCELDEIGISLRLNMIDAEGAVTWLYHIGADQFVNVDPWRNRIGVHP